MEIITTEIPDVKIIKPSVYGDSRGFFTESWNQGEFSSKVEEASFVQDNHSRSKYGTLRGLHYQMKNAQGKLVRVVSGEVFDVAVDMRLDSPSFGKHVSAVLSAENMMQFWVPKGFAHGFLVLSESADFLYKTTDYYHSESEETLLWDDPFLNIDWPLERIKGELLLSQKDCQGNSFATATYF